YDPATGFTTWAALEKGIDAGGDGDGQPERSEWETVPDTGDAGSETNWTEIENFAPTVANVDLLRWQVLSAAAGLRAGTLATVKAAVQQVLTGDRHVQVVGHVDDDPFKILILTEQNETPGNPDIGDASEIVLVAARAVIAAGFEV